MPEKELDSHLPRSDLRSQTPPTVLVFVSGRSESELVAKVLGDPLLQADGGLEVKTG